MFLVSGPVQYIHTYIGLSLSATPVKSKDSGRNISMYPGVHQLRPVDTASNQILLKCEAK